MCLIVVSMCHTFFFAYVWKAFCSWIKNDLIMKFLLKPSKIFSQWVECWNEFVVFGLTHIWVVKFIQICLWCNGSVKFRDYKTWSISWLDFNWTEQYNGCSKVQYSFDNIFDIKILLVTGILVWIFERQCNDIHLGSVKIM